MKLSLSLFPLSLCLSLGLFSQPIQHVPQKEIKFTWQEAGSVWMYDSTHLYSYDTRGNILIEQIEDTIVGQPLRKSFRAYNADDRMISDSLLIWENNAWKPVQWLRLQFYDQPNATYSPERVWTILHPSLQEGTVLLWNESTNNWDTTLQYVFPIIFDPDGRDLEWTWQSWKPDTHILCNFSRERFEYTPQGALQRRTYQTWDSDSSDWQNAAQVVYSYKANGDTDVKLARLWDGQNGTWRSTFRDHRFFFDGNGNVIKFERQNWINGLWVDAWSIQTDYEPDSMSYIQTRKLFDSGLWINDRRWHRFYDAQENEVLHLRQSWDATAGVWVNDGGDEWLNYYDAEGRMVERVKRTWDDYQGFLVNENRSLFLDFQTIGTVGLEEEILTDIQLFPNPTKGQSFLRWEVGVQILQYELFDVNGRQLHTQQILPHVREIELSLHNLPDGLYHIKLTSDQGVWVEKLIKREGL